MFLLPGFITLSIFRRGGVTSNSALLKFFVVFYLHTHTHINQNQEDFTSIVIFFTYLFFLHCGLFCFHFLTFYRADGRFFFSFLVLGCPILRSTPIFKLNSWRFTSRVKLPEDTDSHPERSWTQFITHRSSVKPVLSREIGKYVCVCVCVDFVSMPEKLWPYRAAAPQWTCWRNAWNVPVCLSHPLLQLLLFQIHAPIQSTNLSEELEQHHRYIFQGWGLNLEPPARQVPHFPCTTARPNRE